MIVNPQLFNYRLIIGSLVVGIAVLSILGFTNYQSIQSQQQFLEQENKLIQSELSEMIKRYDEVSLKSDRFASQLEISKIETQNALDSIQLLKSKLSELSKIKRQVSVLQSKNRELSNAISSVQLKNSELERASTASQTALQSQQQINVALIEENNSLKETLKKASHLTANSFKATALNKVLGKTVVTSKASKTETIEVSFTLGENVFAEVGEKDIYIQILTPDHNVFADKGAVVFGESSLIYSIKKIVPYNNHVLDVSVAINAQKDDHPLIEGTYFINVFNEDQKLGGTQLQLD